MPVDFHEPYLLFVAVLMLVLSVADAFLTVTLMTEGAEETNPLLAFVLNEHPRLFAACKMALTGLGVVLLVALSRTLLFRIVPASVFLQGLAVAYFVLVVGQRLAVMGQAPTLDQRARGCYGRQVAGKYWAGTVGGM
jgi:hypothetical protein